MADTGRRRPDEVDPGTRGSVSGKSLCGCGSRCGSPRRPSAASSVARAARAADFRSKAWAGSWKPGDVGVDPDVLHALLDEVQLRQTPARSPCSSRTTRVLRHRVADGARCRGADVLGPVRREQLVDLGAGPGHGGGAARLCRERRSVGGGGLTGDATVDQELDEAVPPGGWRRAVRWRPRRSRTARTSVLWSSGRTRARPSSSGPWARHLDGITRDVEHLQFEEGLADRPAA